MTSQFIQIKTWEMWIDVRVLGGIEGKDFSVPEASMDQSEAGFQTTFGRPPAPSLARLTRSREILHQADSMAVNGPGGMYKLNSIYTTSNDTMPLPTCMYSMKNIHGECVSNVEVSGLINGGFQLLFLCRLGTGGEWKHGRRQPRQTGFTPDPARV